MKLNVVYNVSRLLLKLDPCKHDVAIFVFVEDKCLQQIRTENLHSEKRERAKCQSVPRQDPEPLNP